MKRIDRDQLKKDINLLIECYKIAHYMQTGGGNSICPNEILNKSCYDCQLIRYMTIRYLEGVE